MKKSIAFFFLFVFCISLPGFSVELHYCKGEVTDISFFGEASCVCKTEVQLTKEKQESTCEKHCHKSVKSEKKSEKIHKKNSCCKTEKLTFSSAPLKAHSNSKVAEVFSLIAVLNPYFLSQLDQQTVAFSDFYSSPRYVRDLTILHAVYRI